jgi:methyl coenzyme M reductase beta subunit
VSLTAPVDGTYAGILFFEDRSAPASYDNYGGGSSAVYQGTSTRSRRSRGFRVSAYFYPCH